MSAKQLRRLLRNHETVTPSGQTTWASEPAMFGIDGEGTIRGSCVSPLGVNPVADGILNALESINAKEHANA